VIALPGELADFSDAVLAVGDPIFVCCRRRRVSGSEPEVSCDRPQPDRESSPARGNHVRDHAREHGIIFPELRHDEAEGNPAISNRNAGDARHNELTGVRGQLLQSSDRGDQDG
jgi:hypothetical protein